MVVGNLQYYVKIFGFTGKKNTKQTNKFEFGFGFANQTRQGTVVPIVKGCYGQLPTLVKSPL